MQQITKTKRNLDRQAGYIYLASILALLIFVTVVLLAYTATKETARKIADQTRADAAVISGSSIQALGFDANAIMNDTILALHAMEGTVLTVGTLTGLILAVTIIMLPEGLSVFSESVDFSHELLDLNKEVARIRNYLNAYAFPGLTLAIQSGVAIDKQALALPYPINVFPPGNEDHDFLESAEGIDFDPSEQEPEQSCVEELLATGAERVYLASDTLPEAFLHLRADLIAADKLLKKAIFQILSGLLNRGQAEVEEFSADVIDRAMQAAKLEETFAAVMTNELESFLASTNFSGKVDDVQTVAQTISQRAKDKLDQLLKPVFTTYEAVYSLVPNKSHPALLSVHELINRLHAQIEQMAETWQDGLAASYQKPDVLLASGAAFPDINYQYQIDAAIKGAVTQALSHVKQSIDNLLAALHGMSNQAMQRARSFIDKLIARVLCRLPLGFLKKLPAPTMLPHEFDRVQTIASAVMRYQDRPFTHLFGASNYFSNKQLNMAIGQAQVNALRTEPGDIIMFPGFETRLQPVDVHRRLDFFGEKLREMISGLILH